MVPVDRTVSPWAPALRCVLVRNGLVPGLPPPVVVPGRDPDAADPGDRTGGRCWDGELGGWSSMGPSWGEAL